MEDSEVKDLETRAKALNSKLEKLPPISSECCIYRVPKRLRDVKEKAYTPQVVSIGPLHHVRLGTNSCLEPMDEQKMRYVKDFLERTKVSLESCFKSMKEWEPRIRACYAVTLEYEEDELVEMIVVDGIFTLEVLLRSAFTELQKENDRIFGKPWMHRDIIYDMLLLENQLPFFVLEYLYFLAVDNNAMPLESGLSLLKLTHNFFEDRVYIRPFEDLLQKFNQPIKILHFVDFVLKCHLPPRSALPTKKKLSTLTIPCATILHQAGVEFVMVKNNNLFDIQFENGILKIPRFKIRGSTEVFFRNVIAYEQCEFKEHFFNDYIFVMDGLVDSSKDVELFVESGILESKLSDNEEVATFIKELNWGPFVFSKNFYYTDLCDKLNEYYRVPWHKWKASLKQDYFKSPWAVLSLIAAAVLLVLTFIQTVCSVLY